MPNAVPSMKIGISAAVASGSGATTISLPSLSRKRAMSGMRNRNCLPAICQVGPEAVGVGQALRHLAAANRDPRRAAGRARDQPRQVDLACHRKPGNPIELHPSDPVKVNRREAHYPQPINSIKATCGRHGSRVSVVKLAAVLARNPAWKAGRGSINVRSQRRHRRFPRALPPRAGSSKCLMRLAE